MFGRDSAADTQLEIPLCGGRVTPGVVRIGDTVRRPIGPHSGFVHELLSYLERAGFVGAPRFLGIDEKGREILSFIEGNVPNNLDPSLTGEQLVAAAEVLRRYHDATAGSALAGTEDVVCHNDVSPVNTVFVGPTPVAMFDFDMAAPGPRIRDVSYGAFLWLNLGWDGREPGEQRRRLALWCDAYGLADRSSLIDEIKARILETVTRRHGDGAESAARWWHLQLSWIERYEGVLRG
jgi:Phosphotransferase enzyme family